MPFLGPNCYGYVNTFDGVALWPDEHGCRRIDRGVAIVSQSGNVGLNLTFQQRGLRLGYMVTVGNQADIGIEDCLDALLDDDRVSAIGMFLEGVGDSLRFGAALVRAATLGIPIVALHTGRSDAGARIAASHTAALAGHQAAYAALFERYGVISVDTPSELIETLALLDNGGPLTGNRIVAMSCSGGEASLIADRAEGTGLEFPPFSDDHRQRIEPTLTELVTISNPFDYHTFMWGDRAAMARCFTAVMDGPQDATVLVLDAPPAPANDASAWLVALDALVDAAAATGRRAVVLSTLAECLTEPLRERALAAGIAPLHGLADGLRALAGAAWTGGHAVLALDARARSSHRTHACPRRGHGEGPPGRHRHRGSGGHRGRARRRCREGSGDDRLSRHGEVARAPPQERCGRRGRRRRGRASAGPCSGVDAANASGLPHRVDRERRARRDARLDPP